MIMKSERAIATVILHDHGADVASRGAVLARDGVDRLGEIDILLRHAAGAVGAQGEGDLAPPDIDVGMMVALLGRVSHGINE